MTGEEGQENQRLFLRGDLSRDVKEAVGQNDADYFRVGPFLSYLSYRENLSHFTLGHGGYYSPQSSLSVGVAMDWLTAEGRTKQFRLRAALGYEQAENDDAPRFPLDDTGGEYDGSTSSGVGVNLRGEGMWLLHAHLMAGGYAGFASAEEYDESFAGVLLRVPFDGRKAVVSSDLPLWRITE